MTTPDWRPTFARRIGVLAGVFVAWVGIVEARLVYLHVVQHKPLLKQAEEQQQARQPIPAPRGEILARDGAPLAMTVDGFALEATRSLITDPDGVAGRLCHVLHDCDEPARQVLARQLRWGGKGTARYVFLRRKLQRDEAAAIQALNEPNVRVVQVPHRSYPAGETAAHLIGYTDIDNKGQTGVELAMESMLAGRPGLQLVVKSPLPGHTRLLTRPLRAPVPGATIETTIDRDLQFLTEKTLSAAVAEHNAQGGAAIVMDPANGEILALANSPTFDLNEVQAASPESRQNRAVQHVYEPGSTFKSFIAAAALEELRMPMSRMFDTSAGHISFGPRRIHDMHRYPSLSFMDVIVKSSNVGAILIGKALGPEVVSRYVSRFGFGEALARDIPYQRTGQVDKRLPQFKPSELASVSMGYQIGVTPLQMVGAVASIANGGELVTPHVVRATIAADGVRTDVPRQVVRRTIPTAIADELTTILEQVVERGTAKSARIPGYTIAGKTGTAEKLEDGRYSKIHNNCSFVGFVPSRHPRAVILVVIDSPRRGGRTGGAVAAPVFRVLAEATLRKLGVPPNAPDPHGLLASGSAFTPGPTPVSLPMLERPEPGVDVRALVALAPGTVPDVRGLSAREAVRVLTQAGMEPRLSGSGVVAQQRPAAGAVIRAGQTVDLVLVRAVAQPDPERGLEP
jgi:cell division protein FtsI (penicillin-binding protein 3)